MNFATFLSTPVSELLWKRREDVRRREASKPAVGGTLCCAGLRMTVQAGLSDELWRWLVVLGWRELHPRENRLSFKPLPTSLVTRLFDCAVEERDRILLAAIRQASSGPSTRVVVPQRTSAQRAAS
jgi:hypothetical protein